MKGKPAVTVHAKRKGREIFVWTEGRKADLNYQVIGDKELKVVVK